MNFATAVQSEILKTKRTASFWLSVICAAFIPGLIFLVYLFDADDALRSMKIAPWEKHFNIGWQISNLLFPMYIILICTLIPQIEFRNHTWKQVFSSPQSMTQIYLSKFLTVHLMIISCLVLFNLLMILSAVIANLFNAQFPFLRNGINWIELIKINLKSYIPILGISAIQFWFSVRFKSFVVPIAIGLAFLLGSIIAINFKWQHVFKIPYAHPMLTFTYMKKNGALPLENHEWNAIGYFITFIVIGCLDLKYRKAKG